MCFGHGGQPDGSAPSAFHRERREQVSRAEADPGPACEAGISALAVQQARYKRRGCGMEAQRLLVFLDAFVRAAPSLHSLPAQSATGAHCK